MNEEQAVLDFFSQPENLPLALSIAELVDGIRLQHNNHFWIILRERLDTLLMQNALPWSSKLTEDRNIEGMQVGLYLDTFTEQRTFLRPFMEQQLIGDSYRIHYGLIWNTPPEPAQKNLPEVDALRTRLSQSGFKQNDNFLAWQWTNLYPRSKNFLLRFSAKQDELLNETIQLWLLLLQERGEQLRLVNLALNKAPRSSTISLDQLHSKTGR